MPTHDNTLDELDDAFWDDILFIGVPYHDEHVTTWELAKQHNCHVDLWKAAEWARMRAELDELDSGSLPSSKSAFVANNDDAARVEHVILPRIDVAGAHIYPVVTRSYPISPLQRLLHAVHAAKSSADVNPRKTRWENADEIAIFKAASQVSHNNGGVAWSLNLSQKKIQQLMKAAANGNDPARPLTKEFNRQFKKHLGYVPPFSIALEFNDQDRLHGHATGILRQYTEKEKKLFRAAAAAAGGKIFGTAGRGQVHTKPLHDGFGWAGYTIKSLKRTRELLGVDRVTFVSRELKRLTRSAWENSLPPKRKWTRRA